MANLDGSNRVAFVNVDVSQGTQIVKMQVHICIQWAPFVLVVHIGEEKRKACIYGSCVNVGMYMYLLQVYMYIYRCIII